VSVLLGEGGGGAALAFLPAPYTVAAEFAWLAPLPPEGSSAVLHRTLDRAAEVAAAQHVTSRDLRAMGVVDLVVAEDGDWLPHVVDAVAAAITPD
jgi:acetyl-CoA carboxylase carboxyl transferase subunit beta